MIRNPDLNSFVCCAVCSKIIPPPPSPATFERIREYKPYKTRFYTHRDILEIGAELQQQQHEKKELEIQERLEKLKKDLQLVAEIQKEDALEKALEGAADEHNEFVEYLKKRHEQQLKETELQTRKVMKQYLEDELKRESEAAEQRMAHKLQRVQMECALEKMQAVAEARRQEREAALKEMAKQQKKHMEQLHEAKILAKEVYQKKFDQLTKEKQYEMNIALDISQKENQENTEKQLREAKAEHQVKLEETLLEQKEAEAQIQTLNQQLENMTVWKNSLEAEIADTRQAFQKYIDVTFPQLSPGQADFILPFRKTTDYTDQEKGAKPCDEESMACPKMGVRFTVTTGQYHK